MEYLERVIQEQDQRIQELVERLMEYENDRPRRAGPQSTATGNLLTRSAVLASGDGRSRLGGDISLEGSRV
jgi:nitrogen-specific signal transduction histidine kinase